MFLTVEHWTPHAFLDWCAATIASKQANYDYIDFKKSMGVSNAQLNFVFNIRVHAEQWHQFSASLWLPANQLIENYITWCNNNHLSLCISITNKPAMICQRNKRPTICHPDMCVILTCLWIEFCYDTLFTLWSNVHTKTLKLYISTLMSVEYE